MVLRYAEETYEIPSVASNLRVLGVKRSRVSCLNEEDIRKLQKALEMATWIDRAVIISLLNTGVRRGELAGLTWSDVSFRDCTIHIDKSLIITKEYGYQLTTTKESNIRDIAVAPEFIEFLKEYKTVGLQQKAMVGYRWQRALDKKNKKHAASLLALAGNDFVICNESGFPLSPDHYGKIVNRVAETAGIGKIHPHMFRHTFVSILLSNPDIGIATVAAEAGHAQPTTTLAIYTQVYKKRQDSIRQQMSRELYHSDISDQDTE